MRKFSEEERERIRERLIQTGRELLVTYGPQKTTVTDITDPVGIAKPTFYQFFDAKADLYVEIFEREFDEFVESMRSELDGVEDPQERLERFFRCYAAFGEENEFIQQVFLRGDYRDVVSGLSAEQIAEIERTELEALVPPVEDVRERSDGPISEMDPVTVLAVMGSSIGLLVLHRGEYEEYASDLEGLEDGTYQQVREALITTLARGLTVAD